MKYCSGIPAGDAVATNWPGANGIGTVVAGGGAGTGKPETGSGAGGNGGGGGGPKNCEYLGNTLIDNASNQIVCLVPFWVKYLTLA
jgi:hypothetical protein